MAGAASASADSLFSDGFESGDFSAWTSVQTGGDGKASVQSAIVSTGALAAQLSETANSGSKAYVRKTFNSAQQDLTASGDFRVLQEGASGGNVPFFRFLDPGSARIVSVYRQNATGGKVGLTYGGAHYSTTGKLPLDTWGTLSMHVITNGAASTVEVRLNGSAIYQTTSASLGTAGVSTVQIGNDTAAQAFTTVVDTIDIQGGSPTVSPPVNTQPPTISGTPQSGQTLTANPGSWSGTQPIAYAYQWQRCDSSGTGCNPISGAVSSTYTATDSDVGSTLRVAVTASNVAGQATATSSPTAVVQAASTQGQLVALWHMDELSGTVMYDSARSHDGTLKSVQLGLPGYAGTAYGFNGSSSYASVPTASDLNPGSQTITVTIRLKTTYAPASPDWDLIRKGLYTTPGGEYKMEYQPTGQASCGFKGSSGYAELVAGPAINDGQWHTVQCVKTSSAIKVVVDGRAFTKSATLGSIANTDAVPIGARPGSEFFKGSLDEASIQVGG